MQEPPEFSSALRLDRPLCFFDLETTGLDVRQDRIVTLSLLKYWPEGGPEPLRREKTFRCNPGIPISEEVSKLIGITTAMAAEWPAFATQAAEVFQWLQGSDLAGFNLIHFDIPLLVEELARCDIEWNPLRRFAEGDRCPHIVDAGNIFKKKEPRTLTAAVKFYCHQAMEHAHTSAADTRATAAVLLGQLQRYPDLAAMDLGELAAFSRMDQILDVHGKLARNEKGEPVYCFGKSKGKRVLDDPGFGGWMLRNDFPESTKQILRRILNGEAV